MNDTIRFTAAESDAAFDEWTFNCGPGALCAVLDMTPAEIRPHMGDFERKGYTNPTLMFEVLTRLGVRHRQDYRSDDPNARGFKCDTPYPLKSNCSLMRVQWGGPWTKPGVPMQARYRATHWVGVRNEGREIFDINGVYEPDAQTSRYADGWMPLEIWTKYLIPWLLKECQPKADGTWWPTHGIEICR